MNILLCRVVKSQNLLAHQEQVIRYFKIKTNPVFSVIFKHKLVKLIHAYVVKAYLHIQFIVNARLYVRNFTREIEPKKPFKLFSSIYECHFFTNIEKSSVLIVIFLFHLGMILQQQQPQQPYQMNQVRYNQQPLPMVSQEPTVNQAGSCAHHKLLLYSRYINPQITHPRKIYRQYPNHTF